MKSFFAALFLISITCFVVDAAQPSVWMVGTRADVLKGEARGVSIASDGSITLAPRFDEIFKTETPYIWSSAGDDAGNIYLGTGGDGRVFKFAKAGSGALLVDLGELNVTALAVGRSGEIFAATSPDGKVYRIDAAGKAEAYFDPKEKYIWSLETMSDGSLVVGTGDNGRVYRVRSAGSAPETSVLFDTSETHIISLAADSKGTLYAGTDSNGLVLKFGPDGKPFALLDSPLREIHGIAVAPDDSLYVLALGESASVAAPAASPAPEGKTVSAGKPATAESAPKSRYDLTGAKSAVYHILSDGSVDLLWSSQTVTGFSIFAQPSGGVLLGTSDKGRIYSITNDGRETLLLQSGAGQISTIRSVGSDIYATSSNQGRLYKLSSDTMAEGSYESAVLDAKTTSTWGRIWWNSSGRVQIQTRSGNTEKPDETWSAWSSISGDARSGQVSSPRARFLQWRALLSSGSPAATLRETDVAYLPRNIAPEIRSIQILPTNVGLLPTAATAIDPNIELSGLDPAVFGLASAQPAPRKVYQRGAKSFQWTADDRNDDKLVFDVYYKETSDANYKLLREDVPEDFLTVDGQSLADGRYIVKVVAKDSRSNPAGQSLTGERISEPFDIDNTPPTVTAISSDGSLVVFSATDASSYINNAEYSIDGGEWHTVYADDGIADSPNEKFTVKLPSMPAGEYAVTLRVFDASGNTGNARMVVKR